MKIALTRRLALFLASLFLLSSLASCRTSNVAQMPIDTARQTEYQETNLQEPEVQVPELQEPEGDVEDDATELLDLTAYEILIPADSVNTVEYLSAYELKDALSELGYSLNVTEDNGAREAGKPAILVGSKDTANREWTYRNHFLLLEKDNGDVQIVADTYYGYREVLSYIRAEGGIPKGVEYLGNAVSEQMESPQEGSLRIIFYNLHAHDNWKNANGQTVYGNDAPARALRQEMQCDLFMSYAADVVCLQDYGEDNYRKKLSGILIKLGYTEVLATAGASDRRPIFYRMDKLSLIDSGYHIYTRCSNASSLKKGVSWAVFQDLETNEKFAVFNTHCTSNSGSGNVQVWDADRTDNAMEILETLDGVLQEHGEIPAIIGGDFNFWDVWGLDKPDSQNDPNDKWVGENGLPFRALINGGLSYASGVAEESNGLLTGNAYVNSYHGFTTYDPVKRIYNVESSNIGSSYTLDHIFLGGAWEKLALRRYHVVLDDLSLRASDHKPVYIEIRLK